MWRTIIDAAIKSHLKENMKKFIAGGQGRVDFDKFLIKDGAHLPPITNVRKNKTGGFMEEIMNNVIDTGVRKRPEVNTPENEKANTLPR